MLQKVENWNQGQWKNTDKRILKLRKSCWKNHLTEAEIKFVANFLKTCWLERLDPVELLRPRDNIKWGGQQGDFKLWTALKSWPNYQCCCSKSESDQTV